MRHYGERDIVRLDIDGDYYARHVRAMTYEDLFAKSDIAAELAYRDWLLARCLEQLKEHDREYQHRTDESLLALLEVHK